MKNTIKVFIFIQFCLFVCGCTSTAKNGLFLAKNISPTAEQHLQQSVQPVENDQENTLFLEENQSLPQTTMPITSKDQQEHNIVLAQLALKKHQPKIAIRYLKQIKELDSLSRDTLTAYYLALVQAYLKNNNLAYSTLARINLNKFLSEEDQKKNCNILWYDLQSLPIAQLNLLLQESSSLITKGWLQLAIIAKQNANQPDKLISAIQSWQLEYARHPANLILPADSLLQQIDQINYPSQIALLLPLNGTFGKMGQAVRDGFMTAFYTMGKELPQIPVIKIYDTSHATEVRNIYNKAIQEGAKFIIGPLTKEEVKSLDGMTFPVPTVVLNYTDNPTLSTNVMQFGLSSEQATEQAADHAWEQNIYRILVITPSGDWGDRIKKVFINQWQQLGGEVVNAVSIGSKDDLDAKTESLLSTDQSKQRGKALSDMLHEPLATELRRRQDIDGIFIATDPSLTSQIYPLLRFYYAGNLPVISISTIYHGFENPRENQDLNGIQFDDMPWLFNENFFRAQIKSLWAENYKQNNRLYALGIDSYQLTTLFSRLNSMPNFAVKGVTGNLFLNNQRQIVRQLIWVRFQNGIAMDLKKS